MSFCTIAREGSFTKASEPSGILTIGTGESIATYRLPKLLREYRQRYPKVEIALKYANCSELRDLVKNNQVDVGLLIEHRITESDFNVSVLSGERMVLLTAPGNQLSLSDKVEPYHLAGKCVVITEQGCSFRLNTESILRKYKVNPCSYLEASCIEAIKQFVAHGLGVAILPDFTVEKEIADNSLYATDFQEYSFDYAVQLIYHKDKWISPALRAFLEITSEYKTEI